jgi:hypothetical protein
VQGSRAVPEASIRGEILKEKGSENYKKVSCCHVCYMHHVFENQCKGTGSMSGRLREEALLPYCQHTHETFGPQIVFHCLDFSGFSFI